MSKWKMHESHAASADGLQCDRCGIVAREFASTLPCPYRSAADPAPPAAEDRRSALHQLVKKWRDAAVWEFEDMSNIQSAQTFDQCADELEAALLRDVGAPQCENETVGAYRCTRRVGHQGDCETNLLKADGGVSAPQEKKNAR